MKITDFQNKLTTLYNRIDVHILLKHKQIKSIKLLIIRCNLYNSYDAILNKIPFYIPLIIVVTDNLTYPNFSLTTYIINNMVSGDMSMKV